MKPFNGSLALLRLVGCRHAAQLLFVMGAAGALSPATGQSVQPGLVDGLLQRQLQQQRETQQRQALERSVDVHLQEGGPGAAKRLSDDESPCFVVHEVRLEGVRDWPVLASRAWALSGPDGSDPPYGRCLGAHGVSTLSTRLQEALVGAGFITTRVLVAPQDLSKGILTLTVVPGRLHGVRVKEGSSAQLRLSNALPLKPGDLIDLRAMEQALENLQRVPGVAAGIEIEPARGSTDPGLSDFVVGYEGGRDWRLQLQVDDSGSAATGRYPLAATLSLDHAMTLNDLFYVTLNRDADWALSPLRSRPSPHPAIGGQVLHYSLPWGYSLISLTLSRNGYRQVVAGASQDYVYRGTSANGELKISRVMWRDQQIKLSSWAKFFGRSSRSFIDDTEVEVQRRRVSGWELGFSLKRAGFVNVETELSYRRGTGALHALEAPEQAFGEGDSRVQLLLGAASLSGAVTVGPYRVQLSSNWRGQVARRPLTPQDRFSLGGRFTVRGFSSDRSLTADAGLLARNEAELSMQPGASLYLALDAGWVAGRGADRLAGRHLAGAVVGGRWRSGSTAVDVFAGVPLQRPDHFTADHWVSGFSVSYSP